MPSWRGASPRRWWSSTARSPWAWPRGPAAGLAIADVLRAEPALRRYHWLEAVRGDLLARLGRDAEAREALLAAAALAGNARERALLQARAQQLAAGR